MGQTQAKTKHLLRKSRVSGTEFRTRRDGKLEMGGKRKMEIQKCGLENHSTYILQICYM